MMGFPRVHGKSVSRLLRHAVHKARQTVRQVEALEPRRLLSATVEATIPNQAGDPGSTGAPIALQEFLDDPALSLVRLTTSDTSAGNTIDIETFDQDAPLNAAQFVQNVSNGTYNDTYFQRADITPQPFVLQGGSVHTDGSLVNAAPTVPSEPNLNGHSNTRGTVAFARVPTTDPDTGQPIPGGGPDSASTAFFFNLADNSGNTSNPPDQNGLDFQNGGFTVLGQVLGNGMAVVDALSQVPDASATTGRVVKTATVLPDLTFSASSSDPALVNPVVNNGQLTLQYGQGEGTATITVTGTDINGQAVQTTFAAGVGQLQVTIGGAAKGSPKSVVFTDADGTNATISIKGPGTATVSFTGAGLTQNTVGGRVVLGGANAILSSVAVTGTTRSTALAVTAKGGDDTVVVNSLTTDGAVKSITGKPLAVAGTLTTGGSVGSLVLASADSTTITIGGPATGKAATLNLGSATDTNITSNVALKSVTVPAFSFSAATPATLTAPSVGSLVTTFGDLAEAVNVGGAIKAIKVKGNVAGPITAGSIGSLTATGDISGATITLSQPAVGKAKAIGSIKLTGQITNSTIRTTAGIGSITAAAMDGATIFAGVNGTTLPTASAGFANPATIASIKLKQGFANSNVAATNLGKLALAQIVIDNGGTPFGLAADKIASLTGSVGTGVKFNLKKLDTQADFQAQAAGLNLMDAKVTLV
jgi:cyclophilin family peptidyl-prolyl cis-trans isomerase